MDSRKIIEQTLKGLELTAVRKINMFGTKAAQDDLDRIKDMVDELVCFWELDENLIDEYDEKIKMLE